MKKWRLLILLCCVAVWIAGCGKENKENETSETESIVAVEVGSQGDAATPSSGDGSKTWDTRIAVCLPESNDGWSHDVVKEAEKKLATLGLSTDYILYTTTGALDQAKQIRGLIEEDVDVLVLYPLDPYSGGEAVAQLQSLGMPVVLFNGSVGGITPTMQVVLNSETLGESAASVIVGKSTVTKVLAFSNESSSDATIAYNAFEKNLSEDMELIKVGDTGGDFEIAKSMMLDWLKNQNSKTLKSVCAIFAPDEVSLRGIVEGLLEYEELPMTTFPNLTVITGCGIDQKMLDMIGEHTAYPIHVFAYEAIEIHTAIDGAIQAALGKDISEVVEATVCEITNDNVNKYMK